MLSTRDCHDTTGPAVAVAIGHCSFDTSGDEQECDSHALDQTYGGRRKSRRYSRRMLFLCCGIERRLIHGRACSSRLSRLLCGWWNLPVADRLVSHFVPKMSNTK
jgi:hypothetical protein